MTNVLQMTYYVKYLYSILKLCSERDINNWYIMNSKQIGMLRKVRNCKVMNSKQKDIKEPVATKTYFLWIYFADEH